MEVEAEPDRFDPLRSLASQLKDGLARLDAVEAEIFRVRSEHESVTSQIAQLMDADDADLDLLGNLGIRQQTFERRVERLTQNQLLNAQSAVQQLCLDLGRRSEILWLQCRAVLVEQGTDKLCLLLHPDARVIQRPFVGTHLGPLFSEVIDAEKECSVSLHPNTSDPLGDTFAVEWSKSRNETMALVRQEAGILLSRLPALLQLASTLSQMLAQSASVQPEPVAA
jgi:hypothetical protein